MLIDRGETVLAGVYEGIWFDTGTLPSFLETSRFLAHDETLIADGAEVNGTVGANVIIGEGATVQCTEIENSVILPGAKIMATGKIVNSFLGGTIELEGDFIDAIGYDEDVR
jgi:glucose-1-phosphate thymidylyltransferase